MKGRFTAQAAAAPIAFFFVLKVASGLLLLKLSAAGLPIADFATFSQLFLIGAFASMLAVGGAQNGLVREVAAGGLESISKLVVAAMAISAASFLVLAAASVIFAGPIAHALTGQRNLAWAVPAVAITALGSNPAQIGCAILTGLGRVKASLAAQALGLVTGTAACTFFLIQGSPTEAAIAFYVGNLAALPVAMWALRTVRPMRWAVREQLASAMRTLLRYSRSFILVAGFTPLVLFGLRSVYLHQFDADALGYWLVAQRVSDTTTQLLGLFMLQHVLPGYASIAGGERSRFLETNWAIATGLMVVFFIAFSAASGLWIKIFLSDRYQPAVVMILIYMAGDVFRATTALAMHASLARGHVWRYAAIEIGATTLFAALFVATLSSSGSLVPAIAYLASYAAFSLGLLLTHIHAKRSRSGQLSP